MKWNRWKNSLAAACRAAAAASRAAAASHTTSAANGRTYLAAGSSSSSTTEQCGHCGVAAHANNDGESSCKHDHPRMRLCWDANAGSGASTSWRSSYWQCGEDVPAGNATLIFELTYRDYDVFCILLAVYLYSPVYKFLYFLAEILIIVFVYRILRRLYSRSTCSVLIQINLISSVYFLTFTCLWG